MRWITSARNAKASVETAQRSMGLLRAKAEDLRSLSLQRTETKAAAGNTEALYDLGSYYYDGRGVAQDFEKAYACFVEAAERGHPKAQANVGLMCYLGRGVQQNSTEACKWLYLAAEAGDESARSSLESARNKVSQAKYKEGIKRARAFHLPNT